MINRETNTERDTYNRNLAELTSSVRGRMLHEDRIVFQVGCAATRSAHKDYDSLTPRGLHEFDQRHYPETNSPASSENHGSHLMIGEAEENEIAKELRESDAFKKVIENLKAGEQ